jgi:glutaredoxin
MAKKWFDNKKISYEEVILDDDQERNHFYQECNGDSCSINHETIKTVPQIYIGSNRVGGYSDLIKNESYVYHLLGILSEE